MVHILFIGKNWESKDDSSFRFEGKDDVEYLRIPQGWDSNNTNIQVM